MVRPWRPIVMLLAACGPLSAASPSPASATPAPASPTPTARPTLAPTPSATLLPTAEPSPTPAPSPTARPAATIHYVAIGASDTAGVGAVDPSTGSWPSRIAALLPPGSTYRNLGVPGSLTAQAPQEQLPSALREQPTLVTIWLAVNDLNAQVAPRDHAAQISAVVDALVRGTSARIFVGNVPDLRAVPAYAGTDQAALLGAVQAYNAGIAGAAAAHPDRVVLVDLFTGSAPLTTQITVSSDGFHPSDAGYELIAQRFAEAMRRGGVPLRSGP